MISISYNLITVVERKISPFGKWFACRTCSLFLLLGTLLILSSPLPVLAGDSTRISLTAEEKAWLKAHPEISFTFPLTYPPSLVRDDKGHLSGMLKDVLDLVNRTLGTNFGIVAVSGGAELNELHKPRKIAGQLAVMIGIYLRELRVWLG